MNNSVYQSILIVFALCLFSCETEKKNTIQEKPVTTSHTVKAPRFNADSAYNFIQAQVNFGPRVPNTSSHLECAAYLENQLSKYNWETVVQKASLKSYDNKILKSQNIMGRYNVNANQRVVLFAHWDTRHIADRDVIKQTEPILGANDGASGVGVLLEIVRATSTHNEQPNIGVDIVFLDAEDYGEPNGSNSGKTDTWALGAQYWSKNIPFGENYAPKYGILLDMVGAKNATFPKEGHSMRYAADIVAKVWNKAAYLGYADYFTQDTEGYGITDDHYYINTIAKIPTIDIIHYDTRTRDFGSFHHTHNDNMDVIHKPTLKAVGQTVLEVLYSEK